MTLKALQVVKHVPRQGNHSFRRAMQDHVGLVKSCAQFRGAADLKRIIAGRKTPFARCLTEKLLTYALGRGTESYDRPAVERIVGRLEADEYRFSALVAAIVQSDPFRKRRGAMIVGDAE